MSAPTEIKAGVRVAFVEPERGEGFTLGIVNGPPWLFWNGVIAVPRVPVATDDGRCVDVAGVNLREVGNA